MALQRRGFPRDHRHGSGRQPPDAGCARRQTSTPRPRRDHAREYTKSNDATVGATSDSECKRRGHTICTDACMSTDRARRASTDLYIGTTRPGTDSAGLSANRGDTGRCGPCVGADCGGCDYTARRDCDRSADSKPRRRVDHDVKSKESERTLPISDPLLVELKAAKKRHASEKLTFGGRLHRPRLRGLQRLPGETD
jgi:hypothetical protein